MSNHIKTLAAAQPGGRVRLAHQALSTTELRRNAHVLVLQELRARFTDAGSPSRTAALDAAIAALSAQPSPGGQDASSQVVSKMVSTAPEKIFLQVGDGDYSDEPFPHPVGEEITWCSDSIVESEVAYVRADLSAQPSPGGQGALHAAVSAIYFDDSSDYQGALWNVVRALNPVVAGLLERDPDAAYEATKPGGPALAARQPVGQEPVCNGGFVISNGSGEKYMAWGQVGPEWTADRSAALWLVRRADAEALAAENEDAWSILPVERCALPPNGWACTLASGHEGPCPTIAAPPAQQPAQVYLDGLDRALGEAIDQRDRYHEMADDLAGHIAAVTGADIGEHSSANCPWQNAIEAAEKYKPAQGVDLGPVRDVFRRWHANELNSTDAMLALVEALAVIDSQAVGK